MPSSFFKIGLANCVNLLTFHISLPRKNVQRALNKRKHIVFNGNFNHNGATIHLSKQDISRYRGYRNSLSEENFRLNFHYNLYPHRPLLQSIQISNCSRDIRLSPLTNELLFNSSFESLKLTIVKIKIPLKLLDFQLYV